MKIQNKLRTGAIATARRAKSNNPQTNDAPLPCPFRLTRIVIISLFSIIIVTVVAMHLHLLQIGTSYIDSHDALEGLIGVHDVLRSRPSNSALVQYGVYGNNNAHHITDRKITGRGDGSKRGHIKCGEDVDSFVSYWNDPRSVDDLVFLSPFSKAPLREDRASTSDDPTRYLSFEPDCGGFNNIRMEFEVMVVLAAATGRTLILPPDYPVYLLSKDKQSRHKGLQDFFQNGVGNSSYGPQSNNTNGGFDEVVDVITMRDFFH